jgi:hypothetical protein
MAYWTGTVECKLDLYEPAHQYEHHEKQTWVLNGLPPTPLGAQLIYGATWTATGADGKATYKQGSVSTKTDWTINASAAVEFNIKLLPNNDWLVDKWSAQKQVAGTNYTEYWTDGQTNKTTTDTAPVFEYHIGKLEAPKTFVIWRFIRNQLILFRYVIFVDKSSPPPTNTFRQPPNANGTFVWSWRLVER